MLLSEGGHAPAFPVEVFPDPLASFITEAANALPCPPDFLAVSMLTAAGAAIGSTRSLWIKGSWYEKANLYTVCVGTPSAKKSPAMDLVIAPFFDREQILVDENIAELAVWEANPERNKSNKPPEKCLYVQRVTTEAVAKLLAVNPRGLLKVEDELSAWFGELNAYHAGGKGCDEEFWLSAHSGRPIKYQRSNEEKRSIYIRNPFMAVTGITTPSRLSSVFKIGDGSTGFMERILIAYPLRVPMRGEDWMEVSESSQQAWRDTLADLWHLDHEITDNGRRPHFVRFTRCGRRAWESFTQSVADEVNSQDFNPGLEAFWGKHIGQCARIALILSTLRPVRDRRHGEDVDGKSVEDAARVIAYFQGHLRKLIGLLAQDADAERCQRVIGWIHRNEKQPFKKSELYRGVQSDALFPTLSEVERTLMKLVRHNYLRTRRPEHSSGRGRPAGEVYDVHPSL